MEKLISFGIPCYNSHSYMSHCIESILKGGEDVEIIIVDDGSKDNTLEIAKEYESKYPTIVKAIHQENKGHGGACNTALDNATGMYFKIVDSDDWLDEKSLHTIINKIKEHIKANTIVDLYLTNFIYEHVLDNTSFRMDYVSMIPVDIIITWKKVKKFKTDRAILMHSVLYRTEKLKEANLRLPEHTFYVDNIFAYTPLPYMKNLYYMNIDFYRYYIGREDQSVNMDVLFSRYKQYQTVINNMINAYSYEKLKTFDKPLRKYMLHYLSIVFITANLSIIGGKGEIEQRKEAYYQIWRDFKKNDIGLYRAVTWRNYGILNRLTGSWKSKNLIYTKGYKIAQKHLKLG